MGAQKYKIDKQKIQNTKNTKINAKLTQIGGPTVTQS